MADNTRKELRNKMVYQVFVRNHSKEGTFKAVEEDVPRIRALGTDIVYLMPIHPIGKSRRKGALGSPYAISDYRTVNPEFGTLEDFKNLVRAIHENGMKCIMDVVYNHTSPDSVLSKEHPEWFYKKPDGTFGNRVGDWTDIIDLSYDNQDLWDYQIETLKMWADIVDGFRCDVAPLIPIKFWDRARAEIAEISPDFIWIAESIEPEFLLQLRSMNLAAHSDCEVFHAFDASYDYDIYPDLIAYLRGESTLADYVNAIRRQEYIYPDNYVKLRFLENHDQMRAHHSIPDERALRNHTAFLFFQKGLAFVYAGQEFGVDHQPGLFDKDTIDLLPHDGVDMSGLISILSSIKKEPVFADSVYRVRDAGNDICVASHTNSGSRAIGIFSLKGQKANVRVDLPDGSYTNKIDNGTVEVSHGSISCTGEPIIMILK